MTTKRRVFTLVAAMLMLLFSAVPAGAAVKRPPMLYTDRVFNLRDYGSYEAADGKYIKSGVLYRSGELAYATTQDKYKIYTDIGIRTVVDFRYCADADRCPDRRDKRAKYINIPAHKDFAGSERNAKARYAKWSSFVGSQFLRHFAADNESVKASYTRDLLMSPESQAAYRKYFDVLLANKKAKPLLIHCVAGKDRTGIGAFVTMIALGTSEEDAIAEYAYTNDTYKQLGSSRYGAAAGVNEDDLRAAIKELMDTYGSYDEFLEEAYGLTAAKLSRLRSIYLTDKAVQRPGQTKITSCSVKGSSVTIKWEKSEGARKYQLYSKIHGKTGYRALKLRTGRTAKLHVTKGRTYSFFVRGTDGKMMSISSKVRTIKVK